jgi:hypothetical protein
LIVPCVALPCMNPPTHATPHTLSSASCSGRLPTDVLELWQTASTARWVFRCNHGPYAAARSPCTRSHFNSSPSTPPSSCPSYTDGAEGGGLHSVASTPRAPNHHRSHETISHGARRTALLSAQPHLSSSGVSLKRSLQDGGNPIRPYPAAHANATSHPASAVDPRALPRSAHAHATRDALSLTQHPYL